jgi:hypothetical protein
MQKQKLDDQEERLRQSEQEEKADKLLERSEKLRGRLERMGIEGGGATRRRRAWDVLAEHLDEKVEPWRPPHGFFPEDRGQWPRPPTTIDPSKLDDLSRRKRQLMKVI